jgi:3-oxoacyl-[acyl-carrier protein] reductase
LFLTGWSAHDASQPWGADPAGGEGIRDELRAAGGEVDYLSADFTDPQAPAEVVRAATSAIGPIDILVANHARSTDQSLLELTADELDLCFAINARRHCC